MDSRVLIVAGIVALAIAALFFFWEPAGAPQDPPPGSGADEEESSYTSETYGLSFSYPAEYQLTEFDAPGSEMRAHHAITLMHEDDLPIPQNGEGPPAITIDIYQNNLDNQTAEEWIRNSSVSNFKLGDGTLSSTTVGGNPALSYRWSGLYEGTTIVVAQPDWIYAFSVTYFEPGAEIVQDFVRVRDSVRFSTNE